MSRSAEGRLGRLFSLFTQREPEPISREVARERAIQELASILVDAITHSVAGEEMYLRGIHSYREAVKRYVQRGVFESFEEPAQDRRVRQALQALEGAKKDNEITPTFMSNLRKSLGFPPLVQRKK